MALSQVPNLGPRRIRKLLQFFNTPSSVFKAQEKELTDVVGKSIARLIKSFDNFHVVDREMDFMQKHRLELLTFLDPTYPKNLLQIPDFPVLLFKKGEYEWNNSKYLSVVGTRKITPYGKKVVENLIGEIKKFNPVIVSGMAHGVDIEAHKNALKNGLKTIAVMGTSFKHIYPDSHLQYVEDIANQGCILSEYWSFEKTDPKFFVRRNRIVAGLSQATVVVESAQKGGALLTAELALEYNREVYAVPGRIDDTYSIGCNKLIATNVARLFISANQLAADLGWNETDWISKPVQKKIFVNLSPDEQKIYDFLSEKEPQHLDDIALQCAMGVAKVSQILMMMELNGIVRGLPGKKFKLT